MILSYDTIRAILERQIGHDSWDYAEDYGEPGYSLRAGETPMVVMGNYWCRCSKFEPDDPHPLHGIDRHHPRVWAQMEAQGVELEWNDEWVVDFETSPTKAYRTSGDSYSWMPSAIYDDGGDLLTPDSDIEQWVEYVKNEPTRCLLSRVHDASDLIRAGFEQFNGKYESGWYPGQTDDPVKITARIRREYPDHDIVFLIDANGQFDTEFSSWIRSTTEEADDE